ncbi:MAG: exodeoxyribonuclease VII large subunit, partial [Sulfuricella sp.]|nr:exodeoxyribonuclease VII large subunit [Sulfuricella sp.]
MHFAPALTDESPVLSVSELNRRAKQLLERNFPLMWISGEVSNFIAAASG